MPGWTELLVMTGLVFVAIMVINTIRNAWRALK